MANDRGAVVQVNKDEVIEAVLEGMANGETVAEVARRLKVKAGTVRKWMGEDEGVNARYRRMRPLLGAALAEEAIRIARESTVATTSLDRVLIDTLKWAAAKANPMEYGDRQTVEHQGTTVVKVQVVEEELPTRRVTAKIAAHEITDVPMVPALPVGGAEDAP